MSFWGELKRRNVFKVGAAYVIVAWLIVQVANTFFPILHLPEWAVTLIACFLILGFPVALIHAWAYEVTPDGIKKTKEVPLADSITRLTGRKLNYVLAVLLIVAVGYIVIDKAFIGRDSVETKSATLEVVEQAATPAKEEQATKTIAVLPFDNLSSDPEQEYFVLGLSEEIINYLSNISVMHVTSKTSAFAFKETNKTIQEIANELGVDHILEGSVRKAGNALRITAQLIQVADDRHLWSKTYDKEFKVEEVFSVQEDIASAVANELKVTLGIGESFKQLGGTDNIEAYNRYLIAKGQMRPGDLHMLSSAMESIDAAIGFDPEFALAYAEKALIHLGIGAVTSPDRIDSEQEKALSAIQKAIVLEPNLAEAYAVLGVYRSIKADFIGAKSAIRKALEQQTVQSSTTVEAFLLHHLAVRRSDRTKEMFEEALRKDPLNSNIRLFYLIYLGQMGDIKRVEEEYGLYRPLYGDQWRVADLLISVLRFGSGDILSHDDIPSSDKISEIIRQHHDSPEKGIEELRRIYTDDNQLDFLELIVLSAGAAYFHHPEFSLEVLEKILSYDAIDTFWVWLPGYHEVRRLPRFKEFIREIGLVDYWEQFGWPDLCKPTDDGDFECD